MHQNRNYNGNKRRGPAIILCPAWASNIWVSVFIWWRHSAGRDDRNDDGLTDAGHRSCESSLLLHLLQMERGRAGPDVATYKLFSCLSDVGDKICTACLHTADTAKRCTMTVRSICDWVQWLPGYELSHRKIHFYSARDSWNRLTSSISQGKGRHVQQIRIRLWNYWLWNRWSHMFIY